MSADHDELKNSKKMSPKNGYDSVNSSSSNVDEAIGGDLQELADVNNSLDELSSALDCFEERTDNIMQQLRELLDSNREIRQELAMQKAEVVSAGDGDGAEKTIAEDADDVEIKEKNNAMEQS